MPRKKEARVTLRLTEKNRLYLEKMRLTDQHARSREGTQTVSEFVNQCITIVCESSMNPRKSVADSDDLRNAYALMQYRELGVKMQELMDLRRKAAQSMTEDFALLNT